MKFKKPLSALVVSALLLGGASGALAASANLQLSLPTSEVPGGSHTQLTFTTNVPDADAERAFRLAHPS